MGIWRESEAEMNEKRRRTGEEGVALIVVLGFLSLMLVIAVSFLGTAQVERQVSDASLEAIRSRQVLKTGLAAAMNDYSKTLWDDGVFLPVKDEDTVFTSEASGMESISGTGGKLKGSQTQLLRGEVLDWIPAKYKTQDVTNWVNDAEWVLVREEPGQRSRILGRYAYVCFDTSGALDANYVAREESVGATLDKVKTTNRFHRSIRSVPMGLLPELGSAGAFKTYREAWQGFDSLQMLVKLTDGKAEDGNGSSARWQGDRKENGTAGLVPEKVTELTSYSLSAYRGGRYDRGGKKWERPKFIEPKDGSGWRDATEPIRGQMADVMSHMDDILKDFTSKSVAPEGVDYPSVKNVPMFNEIIVRKMHLNQPVKKEIPAEGGGAYEVYEYSATVEVQFEFWYPFPSKSNERAEKFKLTAPSLSMGSSPGAAQIIMPVALVTPLGKRIMLEGSTTVAEPDGGILEVSAKYNNGKPYVTAAFKYKTTFNATKDMDSDSCQLWWRGWQTQQPIELKYGDKAVDQMPKGLGRSLSVMIPAGSDDPGEGTYSKEVCDPRLNHLSSEWQDAPDTEGSPDAVNKCTESNGSFLKEGAAMFCRNGPLDTPADFGFLPTGKRWQTIDLLNEDGAEFLAMSTVDANLYAAVANKSKGNVFYTNAQLNVNTRCSNALASVFYGLSTLAVPGWEPEKSEGTDSLEETAAREIARRIMAETKDKPYQSGLDWAGNAGLMGDNGWLAAQGLNRNQRESLLRNTYGVFSVADSLFTVVVVAQSIKEGPDKIGTWDSEDQVTGERRGVALVWRDPFKPSDQKYHHEMMVKMFRYLND
jgi:hypothetical protein